jgi:hypothetical protein
MSLQTRINELSSAIAADYKVLKAAQGNLSALNTTAKSNLVAAINELLAAMPAAGAVINDSASGNATTYSSTHIDALLTALKTRFSVVPRRPTTRCRRLKPSWAATTRH